MPSTYSTNLRLELIASGEQGNTWGNTTNTNLGTLLESAITGRKELIFAANAVTLTAYNGANDESRQAVLVVPVGSLSAAGTITVPLSAVSSTSGKTYVVINNASQPVTIKAGSSTGVAIPAGATKTVCYNGTDFAETITAANSLLLAANPTLTLQAATKGYVDTADATKLNLNGSNNMTGELILSSGGTPSNSLAAISKQYVQSTFLPFTGGTISGGFLSLNYTPTLGAHAVNKTYVDAFTITPVTIAGQTATPLQVAGTAGIGIALSIKTATSAALGVVKGGGNVAIAADGTLSVSGIGAGTVTNVTSGTAGIITVTNNTTTPIVSIALASSSTSGYLSATDWNTFNNKVSSATLSSYVLTSSLSSASVNYATSAGSASSASSASYASSAGSASSATNATNATTTTYLNNSTNYTWSSPTCAPTSSPYGVVFKQSISGYPALTCIHTANSNTGSALVLARTNSSNSGGIAGTVVAYAYGTGVLSGAAITIDSSSAVSYLTGSDYRLKTGIEEITDALDRVVNIRPVKYVYIANPETQYEGFLAHELAPYAAYAVKGEKDEMDEDGNPAYQGVDQAKLVPLLTAAIQELNAKVEGLTAEVNTLKGN